MSEPTMDENYKSRLQEYTQKVSIPLPIYETINEEPERTPQYRARVFVDGTHFTSPTTFPKIKEAQKDVAKIAFQTILQKTKEDPFPFVFQDTSLCKSIVFEYAVKMKLEKPTFVTKVAKGLITVFVSDLVLNGVNYTGQIAKSKKEAEQLAARAAIISIRDSESNLVMSEIIKSKKKLYALLHGAGVNQQAAGDNAADSSGLEMALNKRKEPAALEVETTVSSFNAGSGALAQPFHEFKKTKVETPLEVIPLPITFVPPGDISKLEFVPCSTSRKNKNCKKKASQEIVGGDTRVGASVLGLSSVYPKKDMHMEGLFREDLQTP